MFKIFSLQKDQWYGEKTLQFCIRYEFIAEMGENFDSIMDNYFDFFKEKMNNRFWIPPKLVEDYKDDASFMVDSD